MTRVTLWIKCAQLSIEKKMLALYAMFFKKIFKSFSNVLQKSIYGFWQSWQVCGLSLFFIQLWLKLDASL